MTFPMPRGYDARLSRGPSERDMERETEERNEGFDAAEKQAQDEAMHDEDELTGPMDYEPERDFIMERAKVDAMREAAGELRRELARQEGRNEISKATNRG